MRFVLRFDQRHRFISISRKSSSSRRLVSSSVFAPMIRVRRRYCANEHDHRSPPSLSSRALLLLHLGRTFWTVSSSSEHSLRVVTRVSSHTQCFWLTLVFYAIERDRTSALTVVRRRLVFWPLRMDIQTIPHSASI